MRKYRTLFGYAGRQRRHFLRITGLSVATAVLAAGQPWPMKVAVDYVLSGLPLPEMLRGFYEFLHLNPTPLMLLAFAVLSGLLIYGLSSLAEVLRVNAWTIGGRLMVYELTENLFARLQRRSLIFHSRKTVGDSLSRVTGDSWCVYRMMDGLLVAPAQALLALVLMVCLMWQLEVSLTWLALGLAPLMVGASFLVGKPVALAARLQREAESRIQSHLQQTLTGIPVVQAFAQEDREQARFQEFAAAAIEAEQRGAILGSLNSLATGLVTALGTGLILWLGALQVLEGRLTLGGLLVFVVYLTSMQAQIKVFAEIHTLMRKVSASADRVMEVLAAPPEVAEKPDAVGVVGVRGEVRFENVAFGYEPGRPVLEEVSLNISPGQMLAIVGSSGAGKSTLVNLVPRFFDPWSGRVRIDGRDVREFQIQSLREQVAVVFQEPFLLPGSIADNIALDRPQVSRSDIESAARAACAQEFIEQLPQGYDTVLGERGLTLSGGERQRLALARALLKNAPILILDEPTSALDARTEQWLMEAVERLTTGRTVLVIAHRLSTVRRADRIVVLEEGRIVASGTHDELLAGSPDYRRLYEAQFQSSTIPTEDSNR